MGLLSPSKLVTKSPLRKLQPWPLSNLGEMPMKGCKRKLKQGAPAVSATGIQSESSSSPGKPGVKGEGWGTCLSDMKELKHRD